MSRNPISTESKSIKINIRIPEKELENFDEIVEPSVHNRSAYLRVLMDNEVKKVKKK